MCERKSGKENKKEIKTERGDEMVDKKRQGETKTEKVKKALRK